MQATHSLKGLLALALRPLTGFDGGLTGPLHRLWSFARLAARVPHLDTSVVVLGTPDLHGSRRIAFGRDLYLYRDLHLETQGAGRISIGDGVVLSRGVHLVAFASIDIGAGSMIGEYTSLRDANHCYGSGLAPRHTGHTARPIRVGRNVWIGRGVTVLPGVSIGDGAVIGANAVVTRDVAPASVVAGVPAAPLQSAAKKP